MAVAWIASPVLLCTLAAVGLGLAAYLLGTLRIVKRESGGSGGPAPAEMAALERRLDDLEARCRASESRAAASPAAGAEASAPPAPAVRPGMNLNRRGQALRLYRRGESEGEIARLLAMPAGEVRLLVKVHRLRLEQAGAGRERRLSPAAESADKPPSGVNASRRQREST